MIGARCQVRGARLDHDGSWLSESRPASSSSEECGEPALCFRAHAAEWIKRLETALVVRERGPVTSGTQALGSTHVTPPVLGVMQPYFFPYLGYFSLIAAVDRWIAFDTPQYMRKSWIHRNRVLKRGSDEWKYVHIPVIKAPRETPIYRMEIDDRVDWRDDLVRNLDYYRDARAPYYRQTLDALTAILATRESNLSIYLTGLLIRTCRLVGIETPIERLSHMRLELGEIEVPGDWALRISERLGAKTYVNAPGGTELFDRARFEASGIDLRFLRLDSIVYSQGNRPFVSGLSILDALMWNGFDRVSEMVRGYTLVP